MFMPLPEHFSTVSEWGILARDSLWLVNRTGNSDLKSNSQIPSSGPLSFPSIVLLLPWYGSVSVITSRSSTKVSRVPT